MPVVASTEATIASDKTLNHEYLSMDGMKELYTLASKLILGAESPAIVENRVRSQGFLLEFSKCSMMICDL